ncbi:hypothetical protein OU800_21015 [Pseudomonas sp. GOM7]|nr:hypothetical protein [Pseudomonas sp. GOM7]WAJ37058.1 hypothetical protein OU800_21015 [Pseudomonas sp. GOM7]
MDKAKLVHHDWVEHCETREPADDGFRVALPLLRVASLTKTTKAPKRAPSVEAGVAGRSGGAVDTDAVCAVCGYAIGSDAISTICSYTVGTYTVCTVFGYSVRADTVRAIFGYHRDSSGLNGNLRQGECAGGQGGDNEAGEDLLFHGSAPDQGWKVTTGPMLPIKI